MKPDIIISFTKLQMPKNINIKTLANEHNAL